MAGGRGDLRPGRDPARDQRLQRLLDRGHGGRPVRGDQPPLGSISPPGRAPGTPARRVARTPPARCGSAPRTGGSRPRSPRGPGGRARGRARASSRSGTAGAGRRSGERPRPGRGACGSRRSPGARARAAAIASSTASSSAAGGASSTSTRPERVRMRTPATTIATATHERRDRVEGGLAGDLDQQQADQHPDRGHRVGAQVGGVALERRRAQGPRPPVEEGRDADVGDRREGDHRDADAEVRDLGAGDQPPGGLEDDDPGADQDQHPLDRRRQVLELLVAVGVLGGRRARRRRGRRRRRPPRRAGRSPSGSPR